MNEQKKAEPHPKDAPPVADRNIVKCEHCGGKTSDVLVDCSDCGATRHIASNFVSRLYDSCEEAFKCNEPSRADRISIILGAYGHPVESEQSDVVDLLADILHYCKEMNDHGDLSPHFSALVADAEAHFVAEVQEVQS